MAGEGVAKNQEQRFPMKPQEYIEAARVPRDLEPQQFGLWTIQRLEAGGQLISRTERAMHVERCGFPDYTLLRRMTEATMHVEGEIVMEDSASELRKHLPIWMAAHGRVLVTGLGLGCVVRGLLAKPEVDQVDVVEIDPGIHRVVGYEFHKNPRVRMYLANALEVDFRDAKFDFAWHDLWVDGPNLQLLHAQLLIKYRSCCGPQGAWAFPRYFAKLLTERKSVALLGAPR